MIAVNYMTMIKTELRLLSSFKIFYLQTADLS